MRAAATTARKGDQKAALKEKAETHAADLAMGLTSTMKKAMAGDTLICIVCRATALGPITACGCVGGRTRPATGYDCKVELLAAALERQRVSKMTKMAESAAKQGSVQAAKAKSRADKEQDAAELDLSTQDMIDVVFEPGSHALATCSVVTQRAFQPYGIMCYRPLRMHPPLSAIRFLQKVPPVLPSLLLGPRQTRHVDRKALRERRRRWGFGGRAQGPGGLGDPQGEWC